MRDNHTTPRSEGFWTYVVDVVLAVSGVSVSYGRAPALVEVSLQVGRGEVVALLGSNGSGRTTVLRAVSGLLPLRSGTVTLDGVALSGCAPAVVVRRGVAHVPQGRRVFGRLTVRENLAVGAHLTAAPAARAALDRVLGLFPVLGERAGQAAGTLSGGEQQQLAFGRALMACPQVLLLDEPTTGLAPPVAEALLAAVRAVAADGVAVLLVDQPGPALRTASRGVLLEDGRVVEEGSSAALLDGARLRAAGLEAPVQGEPGQGEPGQGEPGGSVSAGRGPLPSAAAPPAAPAGGRRPAPA